MLQDAIGNHALYELGTNWNDMKKLQGPENNDTLPMVVATLPNVIALKLEVERSEALGQKMIDLGNETCPSNMSVIYSTPGQTEPSKGG